MLKGAEVSSPNTPVAPSYNTGVIDSGASVVDMPLYQINLNGPTVTFTQVATLVDRTIDNLGTLVVEVGTLSSLPQTITNDEIHASHVAVNSILGTPSAQTSDWTVTTSEGSLTIAGSISGSTTLTLYLNMSR